MRRATRCFTISRPTTAIAWRCLRVSPAQLLGIVGLNCAPMSCQPLLAHRLRSFHVMAACTPLHVLRAVVESAVHAFWHVFFGHGACPCPAGTRASVHSHFSEGSHLQSTLPADAQVDTQRVWDYLNDGYVHRLIASKTHGHLVELSARTHPSPGPFASSCLRSLRRSDSPDPSLPCPALPHRSLYPSGQPHPAPSSRPPRPA